MYPAPKAQPIEAWGRLGSGLSALGSFVGTHTRALRPRLVWNAPSALRTHSRLMVLRFRGALL